MLYWVLTKASYQASARLKINNKKKITNNLPYFAFTYTYTTWLTFAASASNSRIWIFSLQDYNFLNKGYFGSLQFMWGIDFFLNILTTQWKKNLCLSYWPQTIKGCPLLCISLRFFLGGGHHHHQIKKKFNPDSYKSSLISLLCVVQNVHVRIHAIKTRVLIVS